MITIFNRKELCITFDFKEQARVRDVLAVNNIDCFFYVFISHPIIPSQLLYIAFHSLSKVSGCSASINALPISSAST